MINIKDSYVNCKEIDYEDMYLDYQNLFVSVNPTF